jgi:hypothetical protein
MMQRHLNFYSYPYLNHYSYLHQYLVTLCKCSDIQSDL